MTLTEHADTARSPEYQNGVTDGITAVAEQRAIIEQAKGMLMFIYGIDAEAAFDRLRWQSQQHNVKLRLIAEQIVKDLAEVSAQRHRTAADRLLLTAHERVTRVGVRQLDGQSTTDA